MIHTSHSFRSMIACASLFSLVSIGGAADYDSAKTAYSAGNWQNAYELFGKVADPDPQTDFYRIKCLYEMKRYKEFLDAVEELRLKKSDHPALDDLTFLSFTAYRWLGDKRAQKRVVETFEQRFPNSPYISRLPELQAVMSKDPWFLGMDAFEKRDFFRARKYFLQCNFVEAQFYAMKSLYEMKDYDEFNRERVAFLTAHEKSPALGDLTILQARAEEEQGNYDAALALLSSCSELQASAEAATLKGDIETNRSIGPAVKALRVDKDYELALPAFADYIATTTDQHARSLAQYYAFQCFYHLDPEQFLVKTEELKKIDPDHPFLDRLVVLQVHALNKLKRWDEASVLLNDFQNRFPNSNHRKFAASMATEIDGLTSSGMLAKRDFAAHLNAVWNAGAPEKATMEAEDYLSKHPEAPNSSEIAKLMLQSTLVTSETIPTGTFEKVEKFMSDSKNRSAFRQERFGEVGLNQEFSTRKEDAVYLEQFVQENPGHWRTRYAARVAALKFLELGEYEKSSRMAELALQTSDTLTKDECNELRFIAASTQALMGNKEKSKQILDSLVWDNDTRYYYTNQVMLECERIFNDTKGKNLTLKVTQAISSLYTPQDREWYAAKSYEGVSLYFIGMGQKDLSEKRKYFDLATNIWTGILSQSSKAREPFLAEVQASAIEYLLSMSQTQGDVKTLYKSLEEQISPSYKRTKVLKDYGNKIVFREAR